MSYINPYDYKPRPLIRYCGDEENQNPLTFGVEAEIDVVSNRTHGDRDELAEKLFKMGEGRVYLKSDGSLNNGGSHSGIEIVTHPGTLRHHMNEMHWSGLCNSAIKAGFRSHIAGDCGLHIHVGRAGLGRTTQQQDESIRKITAFVHLHWEEMFVFSRRKSRDPNSGDLKWAKPMPHVLDAVQRGQLTAAWARTHIRTSNTHSDRYYALNCENDATLEFRIFRGSIRRDTVIAAIQLVHNICDFCRKNDWDAVLSASFTDVCRYHAYNELNAYLYHRKIVDEMVLPFRTSRIPEFKGPDGSLGRETNPRRARPDDGDPA